MACNWSAENATKAYLRTLKMGKRDKEPDVTEFISALSAGNSAQLMVEVCAGAAGATTLALVAAAHQTGGRVVCILRGLEELESSEEALGQNIDRVEFVIGDAQALLINCYKAADFVLIDCNLDDPDSIFRAVQAEGGGGGGGAVVVRYNAFCRDSWRSNSSSGSGSNTHLLPIGEGLLVTRMASKKMVKSNVGVNVNERNGTTREKSRWVVRIDKCTGEEHVFRIRSPSSHREGIEA
ncbi:hypothetical protein Scep_006643 [Stephania cephalantha]|uniref:S-adenosyl-L-methionine-dependent methyltransferase n=1 Tax=Stephania cephalantha TaxID=152367 RepID=A0AAP0K8L4_9MAGN